MNNNIYAPKILSVYELNSYLKGLLDKDPNLQYVFLSGEISNLTDHYSSGHIYLSLKDSKAVIKAVMFAFNAKKLRFTPQNGMKVLVRGRVSVYEPSGQYQLYIEDMQPDGMGALTLAFEQLKEKLSAEGLFLKEHKKPLPQFPEKITVITSPTGAAVQDIRNVLSRRWPYAQVELIPVLVQGEGSASQLIAAINYVSEQNNADVVIIGRGGGSIEDLWSFNDEGLARAIYACPVPVISAVGHETDFTICDFVADMRAPTPSAAAELAVPDKDEQIEWLLQQKQYMSSLWDRFYANCVSDIKVVSSKLEALNPTKEYNEKVLALDNLLLRLKSVSEKEISIRNNEISDVKARLFALDPVAILKRGYTVVSRNNEIIRKTSDLKTDDIIDIRFTDGSVSAKIID